MSAQNNCPEKHMEICQCGDSLGIRIMKNDLDLENWLGIIFS